MATVVVVDARVLVQVDVIAANSLINKCSQAAKSHSCERQGGRIWQWGLRRVETHEGREKKEEERGGREGEKGAGLQRIGRRQEGCNAFYRSLAGTFAAQFLEKDEKGGRCRLVPCSKRKTAQLVIMSQNW